MKMRPEQILKAAATAAGVLGALAAFVAAPLIAVRMREQYPACEYLFWPLLIYVWLAALPGFLALNAGLLLWRLGLRAGFTGHAYGWREGLLAIPRALTANAINFLSALRAMERYRAALESGGAPAWGKTEHRFPEADVEIARG